MLRHGPAQPEASLPVSGARKAIMHARARSTLQSREGRASHIRWWPSAMYDKKECSTIIQGTVPDNAYNGRPKRALPLVDTHSQLDGIVSNHFNAVCNCVVSAMRTSSRTLRDPLQVLVQLASITHTARSPVRVGFGSHGRRCRSRDNVLIDH